MSCEVGRKDKYSYSVYDKILFQLTVGETHEGLQCGETQIMLLYNGS